MDYIQTHLTQVGGAVVAVIALVIIIRMLKPKAAAAGESIRINVKCGKCGWQGTVSKYNQVCAKCANRELQQFN